MHAHIYISKDDLTTILPISACSPPVRVIVMKIAHCVALLLVTGMMCTCITTTAASYLPAEFREEVNRPDVIKELFIPKFVFVHLLWNYDSKLQSGKTKIILSVTLYTYSACILINIGRIRFYRIHFCTCVQASSRRLAQFADETDVEVAATLAACRHEQITTKKAPRKRCAALELYLRRCGPTIPP